MAISLTPEQQSWIGARVARGEFSTEEEAAHRLIDESIALRGEIERDDLSWAKPHVERLWPKWHVERR